jgi:hypothetical protein
LQSVPQPVSILQRLSSHKRNLCLSYANIGPCLHSHNCRHLQVKKNSQKQLVHISFGSTLTCSSTCQTKNELWLQFYFVFSCRLEVLTWRHRAGQAKIVGVVASVSGAIFMTCYKGPALFQLQSTAAGHAPETLHQPLVIRIFSDVFGLVLDPWKLGALCLVGNCFCCASFINIQVDCFPAQKFIIFFSCLLWDN